MATLKAVRENEKQQAIEKLRELCPPGTTVYTVLRHVSRSWMQRVVDPFIILCDELGTARTVGAARAATPYFLRGLVAKACGDRIDREHDGIVMGGCGMDVGHALVYNLASVLYREGWQCLGEHDGVRCPANDHHNAPYPPRDGAMMHRDGGYALLQRWV